MRGTPTLHLIEPSWIIDEFSFSTNLIFGSSTDPIAMLRQAKASISADSFKRRAGLPLEQGVPL